MDSVMTVSEIQWLAYNPVYWGWPCALYSTADTKHSYPYSQTNIPLNQSSTHTAPRLILLHCTLTLNLTCHLLFGPLMVIFPWTTIRVQDMLLEIKEDLDSRASSCRVKHPAEVNLLQKHTQSTLNAQTDFFSINLCFHHCSGYSAYLRETLKVWL